MPNKTPARQKAVSTRPFWTGDHIRTKLRRYDRQPFIDLITTFLECAPDPEAIIAFANKYPDRYAAALRSLGHLAGFAEKKEIQASLSGNVTITDLSDSQLEDRLRSLARDMGIPLPPTIELNPTKDVEEAEVIPLPPNPFEDGKT